MDGKSEEPKELFRDLEREMYSGKNVKHMFSLCDDILFGIRGTNVERAITWYTKIKFSSRRDFRLYNSVVDS